MKATLKTLAVCTATLCAAGFVNASSAYAEGVEDVCLATNTMVRFERVDRKTLRMTARDGEKVLVSTKGSCELNDRNPVRLVGRGDHSCLAAGDVVRGFEGTCGVKDVQIETGPDAS